MSFASSGVRRAGAGNLSTVLHPGNECSGAAPFGKKEKLRNFSPLYLFTTTMKSKRWSSGALFPALLTLVTAWSALALPPRRDINPALLYLHAFNTFPDMDEA